MAKRINKIQEFLDEKDIDALLIKSKTVKKWMNTMTGSGLNRLFRWDQMGLFLLALAAGILPFAVPEVSR